LKGSPHGILLAAQNHICFYCDASLQLLPKNGSKKEKATRDHFVPRFVGGSNSWTNYVFACEECNTKKGNRLPTREEWKQFAELQHVFWSEVARVRESRKQKCKKIKT